MQLRSDRYSHRPYGLFGGEPGAPSRNFLEVDGRTEALPSKVTRNLHRGDVVRHEQAGGGGYGDPLERPEAAVLEDVLDGKISAEFARDAFAVVVQGRAVDRAATQRLRAERSPQKLAS